MKNKNSVDIIVPETNFQIEYFEQHSEINEKCDHFYFFDFYKLYQPKEA